MNRLLVLSFILVISSHHSKAQQAIGQWADQLSFNSVTRIVDDGENLYCSAGKGLFKYNRSSGELTRISKANDLSDVDVSSLAYSIELQTLVVGYTNGNVDLITPSQTINLSDIKRSSVIGDKGIKRITLNQEEAWLATGFGIVVLDLIDIEVKETFFIAPDGGNIQVFDILLNPNEVWAATSNGILIADRNSNLSDFFNWNLLSSIPSSTNAFDRVLTFDQWTLAHSLGSPEVIYASNGGNWFEVAGTAGGETQDIVQAGDQVIFTYRYFAQVRNSLLTNDFSIASYSFDEVIRPLTGIRDGEGQYWFGDENHGLVNFGLDADDTSIRPQGPFVNESWQIDAAQGQLYIAHGELKSNFDNSFSNDQHSGQENGIWSYSEALDDYPDIRDVVDVKIDPFDPSRKYFASFTKGLLEYDNSSDEYTLYNDVEGNSPLTGSNLLEDRIQVGDLEFDEFGNLWCANSYTDEAFKVKKRNGEWLSLDCEGLSGLTLLGEMTITTEGQTWCVLPRSAGLAMLQHNNDLESTSSHQCKTFSTSVGDGGLPTTSVLSIAEDLDGEIWLGTSEGPVVNYSPLSIFSSNPVDFQSILVERDGNVERLLGSESITAIAIDGANRKWLGTLTGGVFLLSDDGTEEILHFTETNSPLFSDVIKDIAIDGSNGAVHIATDKGTLTYLGDATTGGLENECYDVYPNPVRPGYEGLITVDGLFRDSEVKITDVAGNIVFQTISNGGRAVWTGKDFSGNRVSTGVYFALVADSEGETTCVSKILFVN